jgi:hypothetical protein
MRLQAEGARFDESSMARGPRLSPLS